MKLKKGDKVKILAGKDSGKSGKILAVFAKLNKLSVEGLNLRTKHVKPKKSGEKGQRIEFPAMMNISNVVLICPKCNKPTRIGIKILENKKKSRVCRKCKETI